MQHALQRARHLQGEAIPTILVFRALQLGDIPDALPKSRALRAWLSRPSMPRCQYR